MFSKICYGSGGEGRNNSRKVSIWVFSSIVIARSIFFLRALFSIRLVRTS